MISMRSFLTLLQIEWLNIYFFELVLRLPRIGHFDFIIINDPLFRVKRRRNEKKNRDRKNHKFVNKYNCTVKTHKIFKLN